MWCVMLVSTSQAKIVQSSFFANSDKVVVVKDKRLCSCDSQVFSKRVFEVTKKIWRFLTTSKSRIWHREVGSGRTFSQITNAGVQQHWIALRKKNLKWFCLSKTSSDVRKHFETFYLQNMSFILRPQRIKRGYNALGPNFRGWSKFPLRMLTQSKSTPFSKALSCDSSSEDFFFFFFYYYSVISQLQVQERPMAPEQCAQLQFNSA